MIKKRDSRVSTLILGVGLVLGSVTGAHAQAAGAATPSAPQNLQAGSPGQQAPAPSFSRVVDAQIGIIESEFVAAAEAMPDDKFNFSPESLSLQGSDYKGVRTFASEVKHVATANYAFWLPITGDAMPAGITDGEGPANLKSKAEIVKYLKDSFALGHKAAAALTADNVLGTVKTVIFPKPMSRLFLSTFAVQHANDHYGQMVEYLRMNGIVPPASRQQR
jgi:uncharacterized damage-inducible protein DinB